MSGDRHEGPVNWISYIRSKSYGCRLDAKVGEELRQGCCFADDFHHGVERVHSNWTLFIGPNAVVETPVLFLDIGKTTRSSGFIWTCTIPRPCSRRSRLFRTAGQKKNTIWNHMLRRRESGLLKARTCEDFSRSKSSFSIAVLCYVFFSLTLTFSISFDLLNLGGGSERLCSVAVHAVIFQCREENQGV